MPEISAAGMNTAHKHQGDGEQGTADLVHGPVRRVLGREALAQIALDVLDHDDRVVDDDADRQHQPEQRQIVEAEAQRRHDGEGADQRDRDRHDRDDRRAPGLQEQDHHDDDQRHRLEDGLHHLVDRLLDELGRVVDDVVVEPLAGSRFLSSSMVRLTSSAVASALEPGSWKMPSAVAVRSSR